MAGAPLLVMTDDQFALLITHLQACEQIGLWLFGAFCALCFIRKFPV